jgi:tetratricopeptide (TPR) repeat protein
MIVLDSLRPLLGLGVEVILPLLGSLVLLAFVLVLVGGWLIFGRGPRRGRAYRRAQRLLHAGNWSEALARTQELQAGGALSVAWQGRLRNAEGECHHMAGDQTLADQRFEEAWQYYQQAAPLLELEEAELRERVVQAMLAEVRRRFAVGGDKELRVAQSLASRAMQLQAPCPEAAFWQGMCHARIGNFDAALADLTAAHQQGQQRYLDPPLYLGALLLRRDRPQEALRYLAEANRTDGSCPLVTLQLGMAIVTAGGDSRIAIQALQKACGPRGLGLWLQEPVKASGAKSAAPPKPGTERFWVEAFPENRSFVRRLALKHPYLCPILGNDLAAMLRQGQFALAQAQYRLGNFQDAADLFTKLLQESPPTVPLLRGLGLALAQLQRYDQAYKHLRIALEQEEPKNHLTAGYLALCGALGKPSQPEDKPKNVAWAIKLLARFPIMGDAEWAALNSQVFAEARALGMELAQEDQLRLCNVLASVRATDAVAAASYDQLAASFPDAVQAEHAWLYCRAAQQHGYAGQSDLDLFARTFREGPAARAFYQQQSWDLDEVEHTYLERCAAQQPGSFPAVLGPEYRVRGERQLLARSEEQEAKGNKDGAVAAAEVLLKLAPRSSAAHVRLAYLKYQCNEVAEAANLLQRWHQLEPANHWPLCRLAVVEQQRGNADARRQAIGKALGVTARGPQRAAVAFLGARLALRAAQGDQFTAAPALSEARHLLQECLRDNPDHIDALWQLAAVRSLGGDQQALALQAPSMQRPQVPDSRFHYLAAVCHLAARDYPRVVEASQRAANDPALAADSHFLMGWAHWHQNDRAAAAAALQKVVANDKAASLDHARALLGRIHFEGGDFESAINCWSAVTAETRHAWQLEDPLRSTVFLTGLRAYNEARFEQAAAKLREAGRLGLRERRLGSLLSLSLFRAARRLLFGDDSTTDHTDNTDKKKHKSSV